MPATSPSARSSRPCAMPSEPSTSSRSTACSCSRTCGRATTTPQPGGRNMKTHKYKWSRDQIRAARHALLPEILEREGLALRPSGGGNFKLPEHPEMIIKDCYWRSSCSEESGNTIDFLV